MTSSVKTIFLKKTTAAENEAALSYHRLRGLCFLAVVFVRSIYNHIIYSDIKIRAAM